MDARTHLPVAAAFPDLDGLGDLEAASLSGLADECERWLRNTSDCRASIVTPVAKTLWAVLVQAEVDHVARTHGCLLDEIASRVAPDEAA